MKSRKDGGQSHLALRAAHHQDTKNTKKHKENAAYLGETWCSLCLGGEDFDLCTFCTA
jgi:hypothetical protein